VRVIDTGLDLPDLVPDVSGGVVWTQDTSAFFYVRLDNNHRPAGVLTPLATPSREYWRDLVPYRPGVYILSFTVLHDRLIRLEREEGLPRIVVRHLANEEEHVIAFAEEAYSLGINGRYEFVANVLRFTYSSVEASHRAWWLRSGSGRDGW
jgi:oligopeptidase B